MSIKRETDLRDYINNIATGRREVKLSDMAKQVKTGFTFEDEKLRAIREKIERSGKPLIKFGEVIKGIETGCNIAFIIDKRFKSEIDEKEPQSIKFLEKCVDSKSVDRYKPEWCDKYFINIPKGWTNNNKQGRAEDWFSEKHPILYGHIKSIAEDIQLGITKSKGGVYTRSAQGDYWWESGNIDVRKLPEKFSTFIEIASVPKFCYFGDSIKIIASLYFINGEYCKALTSLLNTNIAFNIFKKCYGQEFGKDGVRFKTPYLINMTIPNKIDKSKGTLEDFTDKIQKLKLENKETSKIEQELENIVQQIYELTDEEVKYLCK